MHRDDFMYLQALAERVVTALESIAESLVKLTAAPQMVLDGQVGRKATPADDKPSKPEVTEAQIKERFQCILKVCRADTKAQAKGVLFTIANRYPQGATIETWAAEDRADALKRLVALDPLDDEIPF